MTCEKAEVLDVAQLLLGSLDKSTVTLPEKGTAAKEAEERAAKLAVAATRAARRRPRRSRRPSRSRRPPRLKPPRRPNQAGHRARHRRAERSAQAPRRPPPQPARSRDEKPAAAAPPVKGLGIAAGAKRPGAKKARRTAPTPEAAPAEAPQAKPEPEVKGLGIAAGAKRPGAKKAASPNEGEATVTQPPNVDPDQATPDGRPTPRPIGPAKPEPEVKGLGIAAGRTPARRQEGSPARQPNRCAAAETRSRRESGAATA